MWSSPVCAGLLTSVPCFRLVLSDDRSANPAMVQEALNAPPTRLPTTPASEQLQIAHRERQIRRVGTG